MSQMPKPTMSHTPPRRFGPESQPKPIIFCCGSHNQLRTFCPGFHIPTRIFGHRFHIPVRFFVMDPKSQQDFFYHGSLIPPIVPHANKNFLLWVHNQPRIFCPGFHIQPRIFGLVWFGLVCWVLWHINPCRLINAKSIFM